MVDLRPARIARERLIRTNSNRRSEYIADKKNWWNHQWPYAHGLRSHTRLTIETQQWHHLPCHHNIQLDHPCDKDRKVYLPTCQHFDIPKPRRWAWIEMDIQDARSCWEEVKTRSPWLVLWFLSLNLCQDTAGKKTIKENSYTRVFVLKCVCIFILWFVCLSPKQAAKCEAPSVWRHGQADYYVHFRDICSLSSRQSGQARCGKSSGKRKGEVWLYWNTIYERCL